ncbi:hypothetical protein D3C76_165580 [compost metagenome]
MNHTPGYTKAFVEVWYMNSCGTLQHMMSFQLGTVRTLNTQDVDKLREKLAQCEADPELMQDYIKAAIASVEANDYQLTFKFGLV